MSEEHRLLHAVLNKIPFDVSALIGITANICALLLYLALSPFIHLYGMLLCSRAWIEWGNDGKDLLIVYADTRFCEEIMARFSELIGDRAVRLDCDHRDRLGLASQLFEIFGPKPTLESMRRTFLPTVIVLRMLHRPRVLSFGREKDYDEKLEQLRAELQACDRGNGRR